MYRKFNPEDQTKTHQSCRVCKENKTIEEFGISAMHKSGRNTRCRNCSKIYIDEFRKAKPKRYRKAEELKRLYGLTLLQYDELFSQQNDRCLICQEHKSKFVKGLCVDHCHETGKIRGLLCGTCNRWVVGATKTSKILRRAADYLDNADTGYIVPEKYKGN